MSADHYLHAGTIVNGRYEVMKCLGTGSMGMVYACRHRELSGHLVAMKVLFAEVARDEIAVQRFRNEIVASYGVSNPNVVRAYEYFKDGDLVAFTMEYIGGGDLADRLNQEEPITPDEIIRLLSQMCSGVQAIHDAGIIHRDLKPENLLLTEQGDIKITDFGIARTGSGPKLTEHGGVVGTIDYVSPEYLEKGQVDARSDIYALGVLAYEMVTGKSPFKGKSVIETMTLRLKSDPEPPHFLRPECPVELSKIIMRAMCRDPQKRYQAARDMLEDLEALANRRKLEATSSTENWSSAELEQMVVDAGIGIQEEAEFILPSEAKRVETSRNSPWARRESAAMRPVPERHSHAVPAPGVGTVLPEQKPHHIERVPERYPPRETHQREPRQGSGVSFAPVRPRDRQNYKVSYVSVSDSHLSNKRMQELIDLYQPGSSVFSRVLKWLLIFIIATGVGLFALGHFHPELYGVYNTHGPRGYLGSQ